MRTRDEILTGVWNNIKKAPPEAEQLLYHEYCYIEVLIDIRDILAQLLRRPDEDQEP